MSNFTKLIVNADDFGLNDSVNHAIIEAFNKSYITNTTLMVNMPGAEDAVRIAKSHGFWNRVGLHLNLYEGIPMNLNLRNFDFLWNDSRTGLKYWTVGKKRFILPHDLKRELLLEMKMQIEKFISYDPICMHLDSHGHSHTNPIIWFLLRDLVEKYGFESIRLVRNLVKSEKNISYFYRFLCNLDIKRKTKIHSDLFGSFVDFKNIRDFSDMYKGKVVELMCHPVYDNKGKLCNLNNLSFEDFQKLTNNIERIKY